jgi:hypothetical protein
MGKTPDMAGNFLKAAGSLCMLLGAGFVVMKGGPALLTGNFSSFLTEAFIGTGAAGLGYTAYKAPELPLAPAK